MFLAIAVGKVGRVLEESGDSKGALREYQRSSTLHRQLMQADPQNEMTRNSYALSLQMQADLVASRADAMPLYREALDIARQLAASDPGNLRRKSLCGQLLTSMGAVDAQAGRMDEAARDFREGLEWLKAAADRPGAPAGDQSMYAERLLTCPLKEFADPGQALVYARKAADASHDSNWEYLDLEARAQAAGGDSAGAAAAERKALALLPASSPRRKDPEARLAKFESQK
jgi:tetratricopeptide (TPR) repeat protein